MNKLKKILIKLVPVIIFNLIGYLFVYISNEKRFEEVFFLVMLLTLIGYFLHVLSLELEYELMGKIRIGDSDFKKVTNETDELKKQLEKAEKVISFYSKVLNWQDSSHDKNRERWGYGAAIVLKDCEDLPTTDNYANGLTHTWFFRAGGKMAREYFQEKANN